MSGYVFEMLCSFDDEAEFFVRMGRFFASASVRRECGGYPLNDGPRYRWFTVRRAGSRRVLGFVSVELLSDVVHIREAYLRAEARGQGLFRELLTRVLAYIDALGQAASIRVPRSCAPRLARHGFEVQSARGNWMTLRRRRTNAEGG